METNVATRLLQALFEGYAWGEGARLAGTAVKAEQLPALAEKGLPTTFKTAVTEVFAIPDPGPALMENIDSIVDQYPALENLREYIADLLALHLIVSTEFEQPEDEEDDDDDDDDAIADPRWASMQMLFETRGTEVLHVLNYLRECKEAEEEPSLEEFLEDFSLDEDSDNQEEFFVYEELIKHVELVDGNLKQIIQTGNSQRDENMRDLFIPLMLFFREHEIVPGTLSLAILNQSAYPGIHSAIFRMLNAYWAMPLEDAASMN